MDLKQKLSYAYDLLQKMTVTATAQNIEALAYTQAVLREAYQTIKVPDNGKDDENAKD